MGLCGGSCPIVFEKAAVARPAQGQERAARPASEAYISERSPSRVSPWHGGTGSDTRDGPGCKTALVL